MAATWPPAGLQAQEGAALCVSTMGSGGAAAALSGLCKSTIHDFVSGRQVCILNGEYFEVGVHQWVLVYGGSVWTRSSTLVRGQQRHRQHHCRPPWSWVLYWLA